MADATVQHDPQHMQCMEIWGGNELANTGVTMPGLDAWVYCRPYEDADAGGDVYYVSSCATGRITRLLVADVSGHGAAVCDTAGELRSLMRRFVNHLDQTKFVGSMNARFTTYAKSGCFATAVVTTFFAPTNELALCVAGHPPPLWYRATRKTWEYLQQETVADLSNVPLGIMSLGEYEQFDVRLGLDDLVLCYTDSLVEARLPHGQEVGQAGLLDIVRTLDATVPATFIPGLLEAIDARTDGGLRNDDVTALLFRPNGNAPSVPLRDRAMAPVRIARAAFKSIGRGMPLPDLSIATLGGVVWQRLNRWRRGGKAAKRMD